MIKELQTILNKMCDMVDAKDVDFVKDDWYLERTWTSVQELEFSDWLVDYLKSKKVREVLMTIPEKQLRRKFADNFCMQYGWKVND